MYITLLRLRTGFSLTTIAHLFEVSESSISRIFITWIQFMFLHFKGMKSVMIPSKSVLKQSLPKGFRSFKNIRCSVDYTEFFCQTPRDYGLQGNTYSYYIHTEKYSPKNCVVNFDTQMSSSQSEEWTIVSHVKKIIRPIRIANDVFSHVRKMIRPIRSHRGV